MYRKKSKKERGKEEGRNGREREERKKEGRGREERRENMLKSIFNVDIF